MKVTRLTVYPPNAAPIEHSAAPPDNLLDVSIDNENRTVSLVVENTVIKYVALPYQLQYAKSRPASGKEKW